jgi:hypothetical protein
MTIFRCGDRSEHLKPLINPPLQLFLIPLDLLEVVVVSLLGLQKPGLVAAVVGI